MSPSKRRPDASVVIPCYNLGAYLQDAIDSVKHQTYDNWEIIIVDDGSTEPDTLDVLKNVKESEYLKIIRQKNHGLCAARNVGVSAAKGDYIVCLDADDRLEPTYIEECLQVFQESSDDRLAVVTTWLKEFGEREDSWRPIDFDPIQLLIGNQLHAASMYRRSVWEEVGGYNKIMVGGYEDWEFWLNIIKHGYKWATIPNELFRYRIRHGSMLTGSEKKNSELYHRIFSLHKDFFEENLDEYVDAMNKTLKDIRGLYQDKSTLLDKAATQADSLRANHEAVVSDLNAKLFKATHELGELRSSRLIRAAISARKIKAKGFRRAKHILDRGKRVPRKVLHKTRVIVAPYVPSKTRKRIKRGYRKVKMTLQKPVLTVPFSNQPWRADWPMLSVVIPYYNLADTIDDTLASLRQQTYRNFEVIIVNDGSTDERSHKKFKQLDIKDLNAKLVDQENQGVASARNNGLKMAKGKYLMCLDADDMLQATFLEKAIIYLETHPDCDLVNCHVAMFGVENRLEERIDYDPTALIDNNMVITAAVYRREAWEHSGGYREKIGYEDWDYWLTLAEKGYWGHTIHEPLFLYRTSGQSRYLEDKIAHHDNIQALRRLHRGYGRKIKNLANKNRYETRVVTHETALINLMDPEDYLANIKNDNVLVAIPWMTFGGAETLIYNFCSELKKTYNISFITGLQSKHEWEWKFKEISPSIYHLANLFDTQELYLEFISLYVKTRSIKLIHIVHTSFMFPFFGRA